MVGSCRNGHSSVRVGSCRRFVSSVRVGLQLTSVDLSVRCVARVIPSSSCLTNSPNGSVTALLRAEITISHPSGTFAILAAARKRRLARLRRTASPTARLATNASRVAGLSMAAPAPESSPPADPWLHAGSSRATMFAHGTRTRIPFRYTRSKSFFPRSVPTDLRGEAFPTLLAAPLDRRSSGARAHTGSEPVYAMTSAVLRLVGAFHEFQVTRSPQDYVGPPGMSTRAERRASRKFS